MRDLLSSLVLGAALFLQGIQTSIGPGPGTFHGPSGPAPFITSQTLGTLRNDFSGCVGIALTAAGSPVKALARFNVAGNTQTHSLYLYDQTSSTTLATASVNAASGSPGSYQWVTITPTAVTAGHLIGVLSQETNGGDQWYDSDTVLTTGTTYGTLSGAYYTTSCGSSITMQLGSPRGFVPTNAAF